MSQMLVRIDEDMDKALTYLYNNMGISGLYEFAVMSGIVRRIYEQWKPNHEATLKLRKEARKNENKGQGSFE